MLPHGMGVPSYSLLSVGINNAPLQNPLSQDQPRQLIEVAMQERYRNTINHQPHCLLARDELAVQLQKFC